MVEQIIATGQQTPEDRPTGPTSPEGYCTSARIQNAVE